MPVIMDNVALLAATAAGRFTDRSPDAELLASDSKNKGTQKLHGAKFLHLSGIALPLRFS